MAVTNDFTSSQLDLNGKISVSQPTALVWGADGRLYVTEVDGGVKVLSVAFGDKDPGDGDPTAGFYVTAAETVDLVKSIPNFNDDGTPNGSQKRQVTGIDVTQQFDASGNPVVGDDGVPLVAVYVTSSDSRIGAGSDGADAGLNTNSGVITKLTQMPDGGWEAVDLVRGLSRSEENHATNGLEVVQEVVGGKLVSERLIVASGGNANTGAPSNNFAGQQEQPLSGAILEVDLSELAGMDVLTDATSGRSYVYDLPTLDDPTRDGADDLNDPEGGNDGLNSAKLVADGPVQIYSAGYRNAYDVEVTEDGRVWTYDNGANNSWGGRPAGEDSDGDTNSTEGAELSPPPAGYVSTNLPVNDNAEIAGNYNPQNWDQLHEVTRSDDLDGRTLSAGLGGAQTYQWDHPDFDQPLTLVYGGHPNPTRAEGARAGLLYSPEDGIDNARLLVSNADKGDGSSDYLEVIAWLSSIGYSDAELQRRVIAVDPGETYADPGSDDPQSDDYWANPPALLTQAGQYTFAPVANGPMGLPSDIDEIVHALNPIEGDFREAGFTDGAVDTGKGSINGLAEYTSSIFDDAGQASMKGALFAASLNQTQYYVIGRDENGVVQTTTDAGRTIAAARDFVQSGGAPLGLASIGDDLTPFGNQKAFQGSVWGAIYKQNGPIIEILQPGNAENNPLLGTNFYAGQEPADPTDNDLDGVDHINDPFDFDADNGLDLRADERITLNFSQVDLASNPEFSGSVGDTGLLGAALDGRTPNRDAITGVYPDGTNGDGAPDAQQQDGLFDNAGNIIPGGNAPILQIKTVRDGTAVGDANTLRDAMHTGVKLDDDVKRLVAEVDIANWWANEQGGGRVTGVTFGDGTQSNFVRFVWGDVVGVADGSGTPGFRVLIEMGDAESYAQNFTDATFAAAVQSGTDGAPKVTLQLEVSDIGGGYDLAARYALDGGSFVDLGVSAQLPEGVLRDVLDGTHEISDGDTTLPSGASVGIVAEKADGVPSGGVDFPEIRVQGFGNEIEASSAADVAGATATPGTDTILYDGTDTDLGTLADGIENFDGSASDADFAIAGNAGDNVITVGAGANTIATGAGADTVRGTLADLGGDTVTDFTEDDEVIVEGFSTADIESIDFAAGSLEITINGEIITLDGEAFEDVTTQDADERAVLEDTSEGLRITAGAPLTPVVAINAGGTGGQSFTATLRDTELTFVGDGGGTSEGPGFTTTGANKAYTNADAQALDFPDTDLDAILASERSNAGDFGYTVPGLPDGTYLVDLLFAEIYHGLATSNTSTGNRIFDVDVEGQEVIANLDVQAEAGGAGKLLVKSVEVEVTDGVLNVELSQDPADADQAKLSGLVVWSTRGGFEPVDVTPPVIQSITLENPQNFSDGERTLTVVVTDETGLDPARFNTLDGQEIEFEGITPDKIEINPFSDIAYSNDGKTATLTYAVTGENNAWIDGTVGTISIDAGAYSDTGDNSTEAATAGFVIQSNLADLARGDVVRAINIGTPAADAGDLDGGDDNAYGGAIAADSLIDDAFGNPVAFEADSSAYHTSPKGTDGLNNNVDGKLGSTGSNLALDGSAYHTYRDSNASSWTSTFDGFANGTYVVELHFAELFQTQAGTRVGDFTVNGATFGDDYDAFVEGGGPDQPSFVRKAVTVTDGTIQVLVDDVTAGQPGYSAIVVYEAVDPNLPPTVSVGDVSAIEGEDATITFTRVGDLSEAITVDYTVAAVTAQDADVDATGAGQVVIDAGQASASVTLAITDDEDDEGAETLSVTIDGVSNASGDAVLGDGSAVVTIAASDSDLQAPVGATILDLDFEGVTGEPTAVGGFDSALGGTGNIVDADAEIEDGRLVVQTAEGDINDDGTGSLNDFTRMVDLSDPALTEVFLSTRFDNPFDAALLQANGVTDGVVPNFVQQGIVFGTGTQAAGEQVKLVWGGVANGTGVQIWSKGGAGVGVDQKITLGAMVAGGEALSDVASVEMSLAIDKAAGTVAQYVTLFDASGVVLGGSRPTATPGFAIAEPITMPSVVLDNLASGATAMGVTSSDNSSPVEGFGSFEAAWDFLRVSSPQFVDGPAPDVIDGAPVAGGDFSDDHLAPTEIGTLTLGATEIVATQAGDQAPGGRERDYVTFEVAEGQQLTGIVIKGYEGGEDDSVSQGFMAIAAGNQVPLSQSEFEANFPDGTGLLGGYVYNGSDVQGVSSSDGNVLDELGDKEEQGYSFVGFDGPLAAGTYTLWLNQGAANPSTVTLDLVTEAVAAPVELSIDDADPIEEGEGAALAFTLNASQDFSGTLAVAFDAGNGSQVESVQFTGGVGTLSVPIANDDTNDGDDTVMVTLTGATDTGADPKAISISTDAGSAQGTVTEDDPVEPTFVRGGVVAAFNAGGPAITFDGVDFAAAQDGTNGAPFSGGQTYGGNGNGTAGTYADTVYVNEVNSGPNGDGTPGTFSFSTAQGIEAGRSYFVDLYFAEIFATASEARVFDVSVEGELVLDDLDILARTGDVATPLKIELAQPVEPGDNGAIDLSFVAEADRAKISAIVIREAVDPDAVTVSVGDVTVAEDDGTATLTFTREGNLEGDMTVTFSTADGTATAAADYAAAAGQTVTILDGETTATATVALTNDDAEEADEDFTVTIDTATQGDKTVSIGTGATVIVEDDDAPDPNDIDDDGIDNAADPFSFDSSNGLDRAVTAGTVLRQDFDVNGTDPFAAGFTGIVVNPALTPEGASESDPYGASTTEGGVIIADGALSVASSNFDLYSTGTGDNNAVRDNYVSAADVSGVDAFTIETKVANPFFGTDGPASFASFGLVLGAGGVDDYVKFVLGGSGAGPRVQLAQEDSLTGDKEENIVADSAAGGNVDTALATDVVFTVTVDKIAMTLQGTATFLDADGGEIGSITTAPRGIDPAGSLAAAIAGENPLTGGTGGLAYGVSITDWAGAPQFTASWDYVELRGPAAEITVGNAAEVVEGDGATLAFPLTASSPTFEGTVTVAYEIDGVPDTVDVTFAAGAGALIVPAPNDAIDDDTTTVTVALTDVTGANVALGATTIATGDVTEDEQNQTFFEDADDDGFGNPDVTVEAVTQPDGFVDNDEDADDTDPTVFPGAPEINDGKDNDQDGDTDEDNTAPVAASPALDGDLDTAVVVPAAELASDADLDPLTITVGAVAGGTAEIDGNGDLVFTPDAGFTGDATVAYSVDDGFGGTMSGTVAIDVTNKVVVTDAANPPAATDDEDTVVYDGTEDLDLSDPSYENLDLSTKTADGGTVTLNASNNTVKAGTGVTNVDLGGGADSVTGTFEELEGDVYSGFDSDDRIVVEGGAGATLIDVTNGSTNWNFDTDGDGLADRTVTIDETINPALARVVVEGGDLILSVAEGEPGVTPISFADVQSYDTQDKDPGAFTVGDTDEGGTDASLTLSGNTWKRIPFPEGVGITADTMLRFDVEITGQSEVVAIGFDTDNDFSTPNGAAYKLAGTQTPFNITSTEFEGDYGGGVQTYLIPIGDLEGSGFANIVLINDADNVTPGTVTFANLALVEVDGGDAPIVESPIADQTFDEEEEVSLNLGGTFDDADTANADLSLAVTGAPEGLTFDADTGLLSGTLAKDLTGSFDVTLTATDPEGNQATDTFTIDVENVNDAPEAVGTLEDVQVRVGDDFSIPLPAGFFTDADTGDAALLTYGSTGLPLGLNMDPNTGEITTAEGTPTAGTYTIGVFATDPTGAKSETVAFTLEVAGDDAALATPVTIGGITSYVPSQDNDPGAFAVEPDGSAITLTGNTWKAFDFPTYQITESTMLRVTLSLGTTPSEIVAIGLDSDGDFKNGNGKVWQLAGTQSPLAFDQSLNDGGSAGTYLVPIGAFAGQDPGRIVLVNDDDNPSNGTGSATFADIALVEMPDAQAPVVAVADPIALTEEGPVAIDLATIVTDGDTAFGDLTITVNGLPEGVTYDADTGQISGTLPDDLAGDVAVDITATDPQGNAASGTLTLAIADVNDAPVATVDLPDLEVREGEDITVTLPGGAFTDADGDALRYSASGLPLGLNLNPLTGEITTESQPAVGEYTITVSASDGSGDPAAAITFDLAVRAEDDAVATPLAIENLRTYDPANDVDVDGASVDGSTVTFTGNSWKAFDLPAGYTITENSALRFSLTLGDVMPEIVAVGLDDDSNFRNDGTSLWQLAGLQTPPAFDQQFAGDYAGPGTEYEIPLGALAGRTGLSFVLINDDDAAPVGGSVFADLTLIELPEDLAPTFDSDAALSVEENTLVVGSVAATDPDGLDVTYAITGGADAALFTVDATTGELAFATAPDFEDPTDADLDNSYEVEVTASDGTRTTPQAITVAVTDDSDELGQPTTILRVNAFGPTLEATDGGLDWLSDLEAQTAFTLTTSDPRGDDPAAGYTGTTLPAGLPEAALDTARSSNDPFTYSVDVENGTYGVTLYIAELFGGAGPGFRDFDATLEGVVPAAFDDIEPTGQFGDEVGVLTAQVTVGDGTLDIGLTQDVQQNPILNAFEVVRIPAADDGEGPTAAITLTNPADAGAALLVDVALSDATGVDETTLGNDDVTLTVGGIPAALGVTFTGFADGVASYEIAAPTGGWTGGSDIAVALASGAVTDVFGNPSAEVSQPATLDIGGGATGGEGQVLLRINAFGPQVATIDGGPLWQEDSPANPSGYLDAPENRGDSPATNSPGGFGGALTSIPAGVPEAVFDSVRSADGPFSYDIPVADLAGAGNYTVTLHFAEVFSGNREAGARNFDIAIEGQTVGALDNYDPNAGVGAGDATSISYNVAVTDDELNIDFLQDIQDNPIIAGIEVATFLGEVDTPPGGSDPTDALAILQGLDNVDDDGSYGSEVGAATLTITPTGGIEKSNFGGDSFTLTNTGDKEIAAVFLDFRNALYGDSVIDFDGSAGDTAAAFFSVTSGASATGADFVGGETYFFPGDDPIQNDTGEGIATNTGGFRGLLVQFDGTGFANDEQIQFAGDMDPNSIAGLPKSGPATIIGGIDNWDTGGVSGAELIGSSFSVLFDDGTTAMGYLGSDDGLSGSVGTATQAGTAQGLTLSVNGSTSIGTYGGTEPVIQVTGGPANATVKVVMTKGINPVTSDAADLVQDRLDAAFPEFPVNNAADFQTVNITLDANGAGTVDPGGFDYNTASSGKDWTGTQWTEPFETAPMAIAAAVVGGPGDDAPQGPVARVYLTSNGTPVDGGGSTGTEGYYQIVGDSRFKVQIEDANANGGTNPGGKWSFEDAADGAGNQSGFQGDGYYVYGSESSTALNGVIDGEVLEYDIFIPQSALGTYDFRARVARDGDAAGDQQNDLWLNVTRVGTSESIEDYLVEGGNEPEPTSAGYIKVFGGPNNGSWGNAQNFDGLPGNPATQLTFTEAGEYTVQIAGRSQGYHVDFWELFKDGAPGTGASDSVFVEGDAPDPGLGGGGGGDDGVIRRGIVASSDDTDQNSNGGSVNLTKPDVELGDSGRDVGLRFTDIDLASLVGADITDVYIEFVGRPSGGNSGTVDATIALEDSVSAETFSATNAPSDRDAFDFVAWSDSTVPSPGDVFRTADLSEMLEAFVQQNQATVSDSDEIAFVIEDNAGVRKAVAFDGDPNDAPVLVIEYDLG